MSQINFTPFPTLHTERLAKIIEFGFQVLNLKKLEAHINRFNAPSIKLLEKFNFALTGHPTKKKSFLH